jgi:hypothetical protein
MKSMHHTRLHRSLLSFALSCCHVGPAKQYQVRKSMRLLSIQKDQMQVGSLVLLATRYDGNVLTESVSQAMGDSRASHAW